MGFRCGKNDLTFAQTDGKMPFVRSGDALVNVPAECDLQWPSRCTQQSRSGQFSSEEEAQSARYTGQPICSILSLEIVDTMPFPVDAKWIMQTEERLGVRFPASFVSAMTKMNGGSVRTRIDQFQLFPFFDASDRKRIHRTCSSIDRETNTTRKGWISFPPHAVAIGANGAGDLLVLIPVPDHPDTLQHSIYWWDHETGQVEKVADDFSDLPKS